MQNRSVRKNDRHAHRSVEKILRTLNAQGFGADHVKYRSIRLKT